MIPMQMTALNLFLSLSHTLLIFNYAGWISPGFWLQNFQKIKLTNSSAIESIEVLFESKWLCLEIENIKFFNKIYQIKI